jgi:hypothetical protein
MATVNPILDYPTPSPSPERLTLEEGADFVRVFLPAKPEWTFILSICGTAFTALLTTLTPVFIACMMWRVVHAQAGGPLPPAMRTGLWHLIVTVARAWWIWAFIWWVWAILAWLKYRRWGRVPRVLLADRQGLTLSYLGWWRMRQTHWSASEIAAIELRLFRINLNWRSTAADLLIRYQRGFPRRFRLSSADPELPPRIAARIRAMLGFDARQ